MAFPWAPIIAGAFGLGSSIFSAKSQEKGQEATNIASAKEAQKNRDWQKEMSSTAHTREVADLRKAGLNPVLSAKYGGASTPGGAVASFSNPKKGYSDISNSVNASQLMVNSAMANKLQTEQEGQHERNKWITPLNIAKIAGGAGASAWGISKIIPFLKKQAKVRKYKLKGFTKGAGRRMRSFGAYYPNWLPKPWNQHKQTGNIT